MSELRSFRARFLVGALLWTLGLLAVTHAAAIVLIRHFRTTAFHLSPMWLVAAFALMVAGLMQLRRGLSLFAQLRARLADVRDGTTRRLEGEYPNEVQPLVDDLNALLDQREEAVRRAQAKAGDLAHGLKTPLAVLAQEAERAAASGNEEIASTIREEVERMRRQVEVHLAQARAAGSGAAPGARTPIRPAVEAVARTLQRLYAEKAPTIVIAVGEDHIFRGERPDLDEMLGNLLDNACKWGRAKVIVAAERRNGDIAITIDDDGSGIDPSIADRLLQRGVRADESAPGSGLGLAIVRDLAAVYGGSIALGRSPEGGVRATLRLPAA